MWHIYVAMTYILDKTNHENAWNTRVFQAFFIDIYIISAGYYLCDKKSLVSVYLLSFKT